MAKLYEINFETINLYATNEEDLKERLCDYLSRISANDLEFDFNECDLSFANYVEIINEDDYDDICEERRKEDLKKQQELEREDQDDLVSTRI
jgi:hypothetical protein